MTAISYNQLLTLSIFLIFFFPAEADQSKLERIHQKIERKFPTLDHIDAGEYREIVADGREEIVVFDVREQDEYEISHLDGAIRVDPDISRQKFDERFGQTISGKTVVFYCSVGRRSSALADRVAEGLFARGSVDVYNLQHGIFGWHNNHGNLVDGRSTTEFVHPYNWRWGRLLERREMIRYENGEN